MSFFFPFRYKLTAIIAVIIIAMLFAIFTVVQQDIERKFRRLIDDRLEQAEDYVSQRMDDRYLLLRNDATALVNDKLVLDVLIDKTLSTITRNDIIGNEVLPKFSHVDILAVTTPDGRLRAWQQSKHKVVEHLLLSEWFEYALDGDSVAGYILFDEVFYQGIAMPVYLGPEMIGVVVAARTLSSDNIKQIKKTSDIDIVVLDGRTRIIATEFSGLSDTEQLRQAFDQWLKQAPAVDFMPGKTLEVVLGSERFMLQLAVDETLFVPPYVIVRSLDESLEFVTTIRSNMQLLGSISIMLAIVAGFIFAVGISSPIKRLSQATTEVARENFDHRVHIASKDEFADLGDSFNQMIKDLKEKQKIRRAFDKSVSKEVADRMLAHDAQLGGHTEFATILFADIRGFTSLSEELEESALINLLNQYFSRVNRCISAEQGVIDKFIGDAVMALFGTPIACEHAAYHGLMAARKMLYSVAQFNDQVRLIYGCELSIGIGLNSGKVVAGMVGSEDRLNFTVLGDQVNIASRVEGLSKFYGAELILSQSALDEVFAAKAIWDEPIAFRHIDRVQVKGKSMGLDIYQPFFSQSSELLAKIARYEAALSLLLGGNTAEALLQLEQLSQDWPEDGPTQKLKQDCAKFVEDNRVYEHHYRDGIRILSQK